MRKGLCTFLCCAFFLTTGSIQVALAAESAPAATVVGASGAVKQTGLHRLDFRLEHASCPSCILKVRKALRALPGIVKCEIALRKPYGGVVIFEPAKLKIDKMGEVAREADPNKAVEMVDFLDKPIDAVPTLLLPKYNGLSKSAT